MNKKYIALFIPIISMLFAGIGVMSDKLEHQDYGVYYWKLISCGLSILIFLTSIIYLYLKLQSKRV